ncbi:MAG: hypothetical protein HY262_09515, partial [Chloroflexi bacterium]|nr:hypothetical protein [Chloroflexota bacterium]
MFVLALVIWLAWPRARYFGNTAALLVLLAVPMFLPVAAPAFRGDEPWRLWAPTIPFL